jgi:AraC-like DNA-binding protein
VPLYIGKTMEGEWIRRIEAVRSFGGISRTVQEMYGSFQEQIRRIRESSDFSKAVRDCREYIRLNYTKALTTEEIARHCGYTEYYLTRKFAKETGMKLTDYIRAVRLDAARVMLLTSRKDIQQISEELQFGSRSYFDRVFRQEVGMSPRRYRETRGQS